MLRKTSALLVLAALLVCLQPVAGRAAPAPAPAAPADPLAKIRGGLRADIDAAMARGDHAPVAFLARVRPGADLGAYASDWLVRPFVDPLGLTVAVGKAAPAALLKLAASPDVALLQRAEPFSRPPRRLVAPELRATNHRPQIAPAAGRPAGDGEPQGWFHTGPAVHRSQQAWARGYTGQGVRHMVNDSGADYCHPDLLGTWAYIDTEGSPYYGLPQMFDAYSTYLAARDFYLEETNIADGFADYADTSAEASGDFSFQPLGATAAHDYRVPTTSKSGTYHYGFHPDNSLAANAAILSDNFGDGSAVEGERAAVLVVDETTAGVYDTVYVDLDYDYDFRDEIPARLSRDFAGREVACRDYNEDGLNDIAGGLVYFISDGEHAVPTHDWYWGIEPDFYGNGDLVAFHIVDFVATTDHGMGCTSVAVGQGRVTGSILTEDGNGPPQAEGKGLVVGPGKDVKTVQNGDHYLELFPEDGFVFATLGTDGVAGTGDEVQVMSNSWGDSAVDNDGFDLESRLFDLINRAFGPSTTIFYSTGNGAPGYGTNAQPAPASGVGVGASTLFDTFGLFEQIASAAQIIGGEPIAWTNRGPGVQGGTGADVVATGGYGTGSEALNGVLDGSIATGLFSGTSMAAPVAAANTALIYHAWRELTGEWPTFEVAKALLMSSARDTGQDVYAQGAGLVDADRGTQIASGEGGFYALPASWNVGDYRGTEYPAFRNIIAAGASDTQRFTLFNPSDEPVSVRLRAEHMRKISTKHYRLSTSDAAGDHGQFAIPEYLIRVDQDIPPGTAMLQVGMTFPYRQFDPDDDQLEPFNDWDLTLQNWTDLNGDGRLWSDANGNGKVDVVTDEDGAVVSSEAQIGEFIRSNWGAMGGPTEQVRMGRPLERIADGLFIAVMHTSIMDEVPQTDLGFELNFYRRAPWLWATLSASTLTIPPGGSASFDATVEVPSNVPPGMYEAAIVIEEGGRESTLPISTAVAAKGPRFTMGLPLFKDQPYDNSRLFGHTDYTWRAESGDWRFFFTDVRPQDLPRQGAPYLIVDNRWSSRGTDVDTIILGPEPDFLPPAFAGGEEDVPFPEPIYGPYTLATQGRSANTYLGSGRWAYQTSSGGPREIVAAPLQEGLHAVLFHQVKVDGARWGEPFRAQAGVATLSPAAVSGTGAVGSARVVVRTDLPFDGLRAEGFGFSAPVTSRGTVSQDDPDDPATASFTTTFAVEHAASLTVQTGGAAGNDIDLYVLGPDGNLVGASTTATDEEIVTVSFPEDGTYTILVHGWNVPEGTAEFDLTIDAVQGYDVAAAANYPGIPAGGAAPIIISWDLTGRPAGTYRGLVLIGPSAARGLLTVPVTVTIE